MVLVWNAGAVLNIAAGLLMAVLGAALLLANPRKDWNRIFALLAGFWGLQIAITNVVRVTDDEGLARLAGELGLAFLIPLYFFIAVFAAIFPRPRPPLGTSSTAILLLALPAVASLVALFAAPRTLIADVVQVADGSFTLRWGPLVPVLLAAPLYGALVYALFTMMRRLDEARSAIERRQITFVLGALTLDVAHHTPILLVRFGGAALELGTAPEAEGLEAALFAAIMLGSVALLMALGWKLLGRRARHPAGAPERQEAEFVLTAMAVAFVLAAVVLASGLFGRPLELLGLVRAGSVALIVYAVARFQLFDVDLRIKYGGSAVAAALAVGGLALAAWRAFEGASVPPAAGGLAVALLVALAFIPVLRISHRLADRLAPGVSREGDHLYLRKLEVYRATVEEVLREGGAPAPEDPRLAEQRGRLGLTERDHGIVVSLAVSRAEPKPSPDLKPGATVFGKYVLDTVLAEGGFGRVFLARDKVLGRQVVIKELLAKWRGTASVVKTFLREAQIAGQLNHPNIVAVYEVEQHGQDYYVVMEYLPGGTLAERLEGGPLAPPEAVRVARALLEALEAAHGRGVVHRDVKPENVLFGARGEVKLTDFGIAQLAEEDAQRTISGLTTARFQPGTLQYMSPEQARGLPLDHRSDLYAVGAVLYRALAGKPHLEVRGLDELAARNAIANAPAPAPVPGWPAGLNEALARALARDPSQRFGSAREFAGALDRVVWTPGRPARP